MDLLEDKIKALQSWASQINKRLQITDYTTKIYTSLDLYCGSIISEGDAVIKGTVSGTKLTVLDDLGTEYMMVDPKQDKMLIKSGLASHELSTSYTTTIPMVQSMISASKANGSAIVFKAADDTTYWAMGRLYNAGYQITNFGIGASTSLSTALSYANSSMKIHSSGYIKFTREILKDYATVAAANNLVITPTTSIIKLTGSGTALAIASGVQGQLLTLTAMGAGIITFAAAGTSNIATFVGGETISGDESWTLQFTNKWTIIHTTYGIFLEQSLAASGSLYTHVDTIKVISAAGGTYTMNVGTVIGKQLKIINATGAVLALPFAGGPHSIPVSSSCVVIWDGTDWFAVLSMA
jgi:hypothetical protein